MKQNKALFDEIKFIFYKGDFSEINSIICKKEEFNIFLKEKIDTQISRTKKEESSPKNTTLYFSILIETKEMVENTINLLELFKESTNK